LLEAEKSLHYITGSNLGSWRNPAERTIGKVRSELEFITLEEILNFGLHQFLDHIQLQINSIGDSIFDTFISAK
jgi:uncharacterized alpha-E superfamily protein